MRVQFSHDIFSSQEVGGISNYFVDLGKALESRGVSIDLDFPISITRSLDNLGCFRGAVIPEQFIKRGITWRLASSVNASHEFTKKLSSRRRDEPDIFHRTYYSTLGNYTSAPEVLTIYDMIHEDFPEYFGKPILKKKVAAIQQSAEIICISEYTRMRLLNFVDVDPSKITVVPLGVTHGNPCLDDSKSASDRPYILYIGNRGGYKNFRVLSLAFAELLHMFGDLQLLLVGGGPITKVERDDFQSLRIYNSVKKAHKGLDRDKLVRGAQCVVSTSLAEGFGLVPLEALGQGTPCVVSDIEVNREIWGDSLPKFAVTDHIDLAQRVQDLLESDLHWKTVAQEGMEIATNFNTQRMADSTLAVYQRAVERSN